MKRILLISSLALSVGAISFLGRLNSGGKAGQTGSPGEQTCGACHSGGTASLSGASITAVPQFTNNEYIPGQTYTITIIGSAMGFSSYGFGCEILNASNNTDIGTMQNAGTGVQFINATNGRKNATHTAPQGGMVAAFTFEWIAPASGTANIYACVNAVNGNGGTTGDLPLTATLSLSPANTSGLSDLKNAENNVMVFPMPFKDNLKVKYRSREDLSGVQCVVFDFSGKKITETPLFNLKSGDNEFEVPLTGLENGIYILKIQNEENILHSQWIVTE